MQTDLFNEPDHAIDANTCLRTSFTALAQLDHLPDIGIRYYPYAFNDIHESLHQQLTKDIPWQQDRISMYGKEILIPRLHAWLSAHPMPYTYSGITLPIAPVPQYLQEIQSRIESISQHSFNAILANYYRHENDSVAFHADDEIELGSGPTVASLSLGQQRDFIIKPKKQSPFAHLKPFRLSLQSGSLCVMERGIQEHFVHAIPKATVSCKPRISLTFREIHHTSL